MRVLFVTPELQGLAKVGGVADFSRDLVRWLRELGHDVRVVLPYYREIARTREWPVAISSLRVPMGNSDVWCAVREAELHGVPIYLVEHDGFYARDRIYDDGVAGYLDNADRFAYLCRASLVVSRHVGFRPQIVHVNDWTTAPVTFFLRMHERDQYFADTASVLSLHNAFFQGKCFSDKRQFLGIPDECYIPDIFEDHGQLNLLKAGIYYADQINAVSPEYAKELLSLEGSHGLQYYLRRRAQDLRGILNGCDYELWNPRMDPFIPANFSRHDLAGKAVCKRELRRELGLSVEGDPPLIGMVSRVADQKGFTYLLPALRELFEQDVQGVLLGTGDPEIEHDLRELTARHAGKADYRAVFDERLARRIYAGSDFFLMPSLFEPCGLGAMYSLRYGTIPIVRAVGGLKDIVQPVDRFPATGTGFVFEQPCRDALTRCVRQALELRENRQAFADLVGRAMSTEFSWAAAGLEYTRMYEDALRRRATASR